MSNIRVNRLALELNVQNDQIIEELTRLKIKVKNHMSPVEGDVAEKIRENFKKGKIKTSDKTKRTTKTKAASKTSKSTASKPTAVKTTKTKSPSEKTRTEKKTTSKFNSWNTCVPSTGNCFSD